jgi:ATP-dependent Lhr-like helicase
MTNQGWSPRPFQEEAWAAFLAGESGLLHVPTGAGKTYAAYLGPLAETMARLSQGDTPGLKILIITPLRALSRDMALALERPVQALGWPIRVESRTGDTTSTERARQRRQMPEVLITTPESLCLLLCDAQAPEQFAGLVAVIVDEWHELMGSKRGIQVELGLARLRRFSPNLRVWALSATLSNVNEAAQAVVGVGHPARVLRAQIPRPIVVDSLLPDHVESFPWAGHLGLRMLQPLVAELEAAMAAGHSCLVFTNTRNQAERWYLELLDARPDWAGLMAVHHGSMDRTEREWVEASLKDGSLQVVVCTSTLDLGVDFAPVDRVFQIGSPKGIARLIQRAGRSGHRPGATCRVVCVPTHALELVEIAAARQAVAELALEPRPSYPEPVDVLVQHLVTCALGGGFTPEALLAELRTTVTYQHLSQETFQWVLDLVTHGGATLGAYPEYHRVVPDDDGVYRVPMASIARIHRMNIGTISADASVLVTFANGKTLGTVEEAFLARLKKGEPFLFAGRVLELVQLREAKATVRLSRGKPSAIPAWQGGRLPLSTSLAQAVRTMLHQARENDAMLPAELQAAAPVLQAQAARSAIPGGDQLLIELCHTRDGDHCFLYPFEGRLVHEGLAALLACRLTRMEKGTLSLTVNDYGIELLSATPYPFQQLLEAALASGALFNIEDLETDILETINLSELARRQFREIARVAGLVMQQYPGTRKTTRQIQASASVLFDVFQRYDPENLLLKQAQWEVLHRQFERDRMVAALTRLATHPVDIQPVKHPTPMGFPLVIDRLGSRLTNESLADRIEKLRQQWMR